MNAQEPGRFSLRAPRGRSSSSLRQTRDRKRRPSLENLEARTLLAVSITEYPTGTVHREPFEITAGPDRNLWFADQDANRIGRMTTSGTFVGEFPVISPDTSINALATGPDGNVWVAQGYRSGAGPLISQVSRVTPTGGVTNYPTSSIVETITAGPDGKMWFTESSGVVGSIDPATGLLAESHDKATGVDLNKHQAAFAPDGSLWFTEYGFHKIARFDTKAQTFSEVDTGASIDGPNGLAAGGDGGIWYTTATGINRIDPATRTIAGRYTVVDRSPIPEQIMAAPSGNDLWFSSNYRRFGTGTSMFSSRVIGQITPAGAVTAYPVTSPGTDLNAITAGPDGNVWFTDLASQVGKVEIATATAPPSADLSVAGLLVSPPLIPVHGTLTYRLAVANAGPSSASGVTVTLPLAPAFVYVGPTDAASGFTYVDNTVTYTRPSDLPLTGTLPLTLTIPIRADVAGVTPSFRASVKSDLADNNSGDNTVTLPTVNVTAAATASLAVYGKSTLTTVRVNDPLIYVIRVTNSGQSTLTDIGVGVPLPANVHFDGGSSGVRLVHDARNNTDTVTFTQASLPVPVGYFSFYFSVHATAAGSVPALVASATSPTTGLGSFTIPAVVVSPAVVTAQGADLKLTIAGPTGPVAVGDQVTYTITIQNVGNATATGVRFRKTSTGLRLISYVPANHSRLPDLAAHATTTVTVHARAGSASTVLNAVVTCNAPQVNVNVDNQATFTTHGVQHPDLTVSLELRNTKNNPTTFLRAGDVNYYLIYVKNNGPATLNSDPNSSTTGVQVTDLLPTGLDVISVRLNGVLIPSPKPGQPGNGQVVVNPGTLHTGDEAKIVIQVRARVDLFANALRQNFTAAATKTSFDNAVTATFRPSPQDANLSAADSSATGSISLSDSGFGRGPDNFIYYIFTSILKRNPTAAELFFWSGDLVSLDVLHPKVNTQTPKDILHLVYPDANEGNLIQTFWNNFASERSKLPAGKNPVDLNAIGDFAHLERVANDKTDLKNIIEGYTHY